MEGAFILVMMTLAILAWIGVAAADPWKDESGKGNWRDGQARIRRIVSGPRFLGAIGHSRRMSHVVPAAPTRPSGPALQLLTGALPTPTDVPPNRAPFVNAGATSRSMFATGSGMKVECP
jgi:hypothetical protein